MLSGIPIRYLLLAGLALCCLFSLGYADEVEVSAYGDQLQMQGGRGGYPGKDKDEGHWGAWSKCSAHCGGGWQFRRCVKKGGHRSYADEEEFSDDELLSLLDSNEVEEVAGDEDADAAAFGKSGKPDYNKCEPKKCKWQKRKCNKHHCPGKWSKWSYCHGKNKHGCIGKKFRVCKPVRSHCFFNFRGALDFASEAEPELSESEIEALAASPESDFEGANEEVEAEAFGGQKHRGCKVHSKDFSKCSRCDGKWSKWSKERCGKFIYKKCLSCHKQSGKEEYEAVESEELNLSDTELEALDADGEILEEEAFDAAEAADVDADAFRHPQPCNQCRPGQKIWIKKRCSPCPRPVEHHWGKWSKCTSHCGGGWQLRKCVSKPWYPKDGPHGAADAGADAGTATDEEFSDDELLSLLDSTEVEEVADEEDGEAAEAFGKSDKYKCDPKKCKWQKRKCNKHPCPGKWSKWSHCHAKSKYGCIGKKFRVCLPVKHRCFDNFASALDFAAEPEEELSEEAVDALAASPESDFEGASEEVEVEAFGGQKHRGCKVFKKDFSKCSRCDGKWSKWSKERCGKFIYKKCLSCHRKSGKEDYEAVESEEVNLSDAELEALDADGEILEEEAFDAAEAADVDAEAFRHPQPCNQCRPGQKIWIKKRCSPCHPPKPDHKKCKWGPWTKCKDCHKEKSWMYRKCKPDYPPSKPYDGIAAAEADGDADFTADELSALESDASVEEVFEDEDEEGGEVDAARSGHSKDKHRKDKRECDCKKKHCVQKKKCDKKKHCPHKPEECKHKWGKWHKCSKKGWEYRKCKPHHYDSDRAVAGAEEEADDFSEAELSAFDEDGEIEEAAGEDEDDEEEGEVDAFGRKDDKKKHDKKKCCDPKKCKGIEKRRCKKHGDKCKDKKKCKCRCKCEKKHRDWKD